MTALEPAQLTGRTHTHVRELEGLSCALHPRAAEAFLQLRAAAAREGHQLQPVSAFRDFERQLAIWNAKFLGQRPLLDRDGRPLEAARMSAPQIVHAILQWSALPGASRHHWGTDVDVIDRAALAPDQPLRLTAEGFAPGGPFAPLARWLAHAAEGYGFYWPYDRDRGGVQPEPWHLSYAPVAVEALEGLTLEVLAEALRPGPVPARAAGALEGAAVVLRELDTLYVRYVRAVAHPSAAALAARAVSLPARSS